MVTRPGEGPPGPPAGPEALALAQLADDVARALASYAAALRRGGLHAPPPPQDEAADTPQHDAASSAAAKPRGLGPRQQALLALAGLESAEGMSNREIASALGMKAPNANALTKSMAASGYLVAVEGEVPVRWRRATVPSGRRRR